MPMVGLIASTKPESSHFAAWANKADSVENVLVRKVEPNRELSSLANQLEWSDRCLKLSNDHNASCVRTVPLKGTRTRPKYTVVLK